MREKSLVRAELIDAMNAQVAAYENMAEVNLRMADRCRQLETELRENATKPSFGVQEALDDNRDYITAEYRLRACAARVMQLMIEGGLLR